MSFASFAWAITPGIIVGIVLAVWNRAQKKRDEEEAVREAERLKSERLRISLLLAAAKLSYAAAVAIKRGKPNGEVEEGIEQYEQAMAEFREYERELFAKRLTSE